MKLTPDTEIVFDILAAKLVQIPSSEITFRDLAHILSGFEYVRLILSRTIQYITNYCFSFTTDGQFLRSGHEITSDREKSNPKLQPILPVPSGC